MTFLNNPFVVSFLNDMVDVGIDTWGGMALAFAVVTWGVWGTGFIPYIGIFALIMTLNLVFATAVTVYWQYYGAKKHGWNKLLRQKQRGGRQ